MKIELINTRLLAHPLNWGIVWVTLLLVVFGYTLISERVTQNAANQAIIPG